MKERTFLVVYQVTGTQSGVGNVRMTLVGTITESLIRELESEIRPKIKGLDSGAKVVVVNLIPLEG